MNGSKPSVPPHRHLEPRLGQVRPKSTETASALKIIAPDSLDPTGEGGEAGGARSTDLEADSQAEHQINRLISAIEGHGAAIKHSWQPLIVAAVSPQVIIHLLARQSVFPPEESDYLVHGRGTSIGALLDPGVGLFRVLNAKD